MKFFYIVILLLVSNIFSFGQRELLISDQDEIQLNDYFEYYISTDKNLRLDNIKNQPFKPMSSEGLRIGATGEIVWLRLQISNLTPDQKTYILNFIDPSTNRIELHNADGSKLAGVSIHPQQRDIKGNKHSFRIELSPSQQSVYYFSISSINKLTLDATLMLDDLYYERSSRERFVLGLFYGGMIMAFLYSLLLLVTTKMRLFAHYCGYIIFVALITGAGDGIVSEFLPGWIRWKEGFQDAAAAIGANVLGLMVMILFLNVKKWSLILYKISVGVMLLIGFGGLILLQLNSLLIFDALGVAGLAHIFVIIFVSIQAVRKKVPQSGYYLGAYIIFGGFLIYFVLNLFRLVPYNFWSQYAIHLGYGLSVIILSFGLGVRMYSFYLKLIRQEKEKKELVKQKNEELEEKVSIRTKFLKEKEGNLRAIIDNHVNHIWLIDDNYILMDFNSVFARDWKISFNVTLERGVSILDQIPSEDLRKLWKPRYDAALAGNSDIYYDEYQIGDELKRFEIRTFPILQDGRVRGVSTFSSDITDRIEAQTKLEQQNVMLTKVNQELDSFVYSASHDLKAPLASILGLIHISRNEKKREERNTYLDMMETSIQRLDSFIKDIIDYSRNARLIPKSSKINLQKLIDTIFEDLKYAYDKSKVSINIKVDEKAELFLDETRLKVIIRNVLSNSLKYGCVKESNNIVDINARIDRNHLEIAIKDYGPGIDKAHLDKIFEMFYRAHETSSGTGLGLYIVKETLQKIDGQIHVESALNEGTTFTIKIVNKKLSKD